MYLSGGSTGPGVWLLEPSPELPVFWAEACCPSGPLWGAPPWACVLTLPNGGKEVGFEEGIPLPGWPADVVRLPDGAEPLIDPLVLLLGTVGPPVFPGPAWPEVELDVCVDDDWFDEGKGCIKRELSRGCDARYGAEGRTHGILIKNKQLWEESALNLTFFTLISRFYSVSFSSLLYFNKIKWYQRCK